MSSYLSKLMPVLQLPNSSLFAHHASLSFQHFSHNNAQQTDDEQPLIVILTTKLIVQHRKDSVVHYNMLLEIILYFSLNNGHLR